MHKEAFQVVGDLIQVMGMDPLQYWKVLDMGGRDVNSSMQGLDIREYLPSARWVVADIEAGPNVHIVADLTEHWYYNRDYDLVISTELLEHVQDWQSVVYNMAEASQYGTLRGAAIITCAGPNRAPHSSTGHALAPGEWYGNISPDALQAELESFFRTVNVICGSDQLDVYAMAKGVL